MRIPIKNKSAIRKAIQTLQRMEDHKKALKRFLDALSHDGDAKYSSRLPQFLFTHFTSRDNANSIIADRRIRLNERGYISLTALHPLEFNAVTTSRRNFGFAFFAEDILSKELDLYTPVTFARADGIAKEIQSACPLLSKRVLCEPTNSQQSLCFLNMIEVRSSNPIALDLCSLFFRENDMGIKESSVLNENAIFQLPYSIPWFRDHFISGQNWYFKEAEDSVEFFDNRICNFETQMLIEKLKKVEGTD